MSNLRSIATELNQKTINVFKYGWGYAGKGLALFMYNITDLNADVIDWKNIKPKPFKLEVKANMLSDATYGNKVTWQEVNVKDQVFRVNSTSSTTGITIAVVGPISFKRGQWLWNVQKQEGYQLTADVSTATVGATTLVLTVDNNYNAVAKDNLRMSGYSKPYGLAEGNVFNPDQVTELFNIFTGANMALQLDQNEVNTNYIYKNDVKEYLKQKTNEAARRMLAGIWRSMYVGKKGVVTIGGASSYTAGGLDYFIKNESGIPGLNLGTGTGAGTGEICINGGTVAARRTAFLDAVTAVHISPLPNIKGVNKLIFFCTTTFMREVEEMFMDKLLINDSLSKIDLMVRTIQFSGGTITFIVDEMLDDINRFEPDSTLNPGVYDIAKIGYFVPIDYCQLVVKANDVITKDGLSVPALGMGKYFIPPQNAEEIFDLRLYTNYSMVFGAITSGAYRKLKAQW
jgi:hypothetical protein